MPGVFIVEAIGQSASILFSSTTKKGIDEGEAMVLGRHKQHEVPCPCVPRSDYVYRSQRH